MILLLFILTMLFFITCAAVLAAKISLALLGLFVKLSPVVLLAVAIGCFLIVL